MLELHSEQNGKVLRNVHVIREGKRVGTTIEQFSQSFMWYLYTRDEQSRAYLQPKGDFVLIVTNKYAPYSADANFRAGFHLAFFQEEPSYSSCNGKERWWETTPLYLSEEYASPEKISDLAENLMTFEGAIYLPWNPFIGCKNHYKVGFVDMTSKGRWLFPHPDGSKAAFEHMKKSTSEDDLERLMPHFEEHPELLETFADLI